jgi:hypothetical protein
MDAFAKQVNSGRLDAIGPLIAVYEQAVADVSAILDQAPGIADPTQVRDFETNVINSHLIDEAVALETLFNAPDQEVPPKEKQDKTNTFLDDVIDFLSDAVDTIGGFVKPKAVKVVAAGLKVLKGLLKLIGL